MMATVSRMPRPSVGKIQLPKNHTDPMLAHTIHIVAGGTGAIIGAGWIQATQVPSNWWEAGPYVIFISSLLYAVIHLWKALQAANKERHKQAEDQLKRQLEANERLASAIDRLAEQGSNVEKN